MTGEKKITRLNFYIIFENYVLVDIAVLSGLTEKYDEAMQERVRKVFQDQNIENLYEYLIEVDQTHKCAFTPQEILNSLVPSSDSLIPSFPSLNNS